MKNEIFINLPVKDLERSRGFFSALGMRFDSAFGNEHAACMLIADGTVRVMLTSEPFFASLIDKPVVRAREANEVIVCLNCDSREELLGLIEKAVAAGGRTPHPLEDHGFMADQGFEDLDGHLWNLVWMAPQA
ncbi:glyoxalase/bleomycin resistance/extradiol dioxygenase family protein [Massilia sp. Dwa41.01b]|uniref:VOC family protein n=1 Tax=unclassified Massilia TaxID=2609279 RepID=UPI00160310EB|nr:MULTISPECIES: VOC family protein [unclassified Massilia]QNA88928.1 glyoxalase/bleomycin resistance/extradiol dioxygenase family protein [Massilia sp. Dwa41.01b]QNA99817.1 glyoxalase/bleomycin resistance/extradiol dioxygenase family protein [Massilia sp. Se16.2.3]